MSNYYPDEVIEEVRLSNDIVDVVGEYVKLQKKGKVYFGLCPFHNEKTPSFNVVPSGQYFNCFGCGRAGNVFQFIQLAENLDFVEAVKLLADRAHITLPEGNSANDGRLKLKQQLIEINVEAARYFRSILFNNTNTEGIQYLKRRGINETTIKKFGLGFSTDEWDSLYKYLIEKGFDHEAIKLSGLVIQNKKGGFYDRFRGRIMFPIFDIRGNVIGFGGRITGQGEPKYMNSPETLVYDKGRNLYALNYAKNSGEKRLILVEGYMDVISLHQYGITNVVASLGTAMTENQSKLLKKYADEIIIAYDADTAGQSATLRSMDILDDMGCNVKVLKIPDAKDPDEFIRKSGPEEFRKLINKSVTLLEYKIKLIESRISIETTEGQVRFLNEIADLLAKVSNSIEREMYARKFAREYNISEQSIFSEILKRIKPSKKVERRIAVKREDLKSVTARENERKKGSNIHNERLLLCLLCTDNSLYRIIKSKIKPEDFTDENNRKVAKFIFEKLENEKGIVTAELFNILDQSVSGEYSRILMEECNCEDNTKAVMDIINKMELYNLDNRLEEILNELNNRDGKEGNVEKLKHELQSIIARKKKLRFHS